MLLSLLLLLCDLSKSEKLINFSIFFFFQQFERKIVKVQYTHAALNYRVRQLYCGTPVVFKFTRLRTVMLLAD